MTASRADLRRGDVVPLREAIRTWFAISLQTFGGPAGQIAVMQHHLVDRHRWLSQRRFLHALNYCMLLPGPEAQQLAVYTGWLLNGVRGGLVAGILFVLPGMLALLALSAIYVGFGDTAVVAALFAGLGAAVVALGAGLVGWLLSRWIPALGDSGGHQPAAEGPEPLISDAALHHDLPSGRRFALVLGLGLALWVAPIVAAALLVDSTSVFVDQGLFFSGAALVTFGGAYAVLAFVAQQAVSVYGWLAPGEMVRGLALAESTPGPLIMVVQFVAFLGAFRDPGALNPWLAGVLASLLTVWVTFVPCFLFIFLGAPYVERLRGNRHLTAALNGITAAVVGVIASLATYFAANTLFAATRAVDVGPARLDLPVWSSVNPVAVGLTVLALGLIFGRRWSPLRTLGVCAGAGLVVGVIGMAT